MGRTLAIAGAAALALSACGGSASHSQGAATKAQAASARGRLAAQIEDGSPSSPDATYTVQSWWMIWQTARSTKAQALALANDYAHKSSLVVRRVTCRPTRTGWRCEYFT